MAARSRVPAVALCLGAAVALRTWLASFQTSAFTVVGSTPEGFAPAAHAPRAEIPRASFEGKLGGGSDNGEGAQEMWNREEGLRRRDMGHKYPVGEAAYQFPPPYPDSKSGMQFPSCYLQWCDRVYKKKYQVCMRIGENKRRRSDCEYDAFRWRRTCYWKSRPRSHKIHPNINKNHPWHSQDA
mmetsp:Transcript_6944/g.16085  ORF Transcript_6944/g.16085 Transcript_6944/m.16085 type:complete len:183 (+) Transcript_6944:41-589(+)